MLVDEIVLKKNSHPLTTGPPCHVMMKSSPVSSIIINFKSNLLQWDVSLKLPTNYEL